MADIATDVERKVRETIVEQLGSDLQEVTLQARLDEDLGADELDEVELMMALEDTFDITVPDEEAAKVKTVQDLVNLVNKYKKS